jgi:serine/threonine-protein phosphatase 2B catalytic subunit
MSTLLRSPEPRELAELFSRQECLPLEECLALIHNGQEVLQQERNIVDVSDPATVFGDLHGQFFDLLFMMKQAGTPGPRNKFLFLGDYVDRGAFSCEVFLYLLALKVKHPADVFLLRGNHECEIISSHYGFRAECETKYGLATYFHFLHCFEALPLAALLRTKHHGKMLCLHGGLSPDAPTLADIQKIDRFKTNVVIGEDAGALCDLLWSDPAVDQLNNSDHWSATQKRNPITQGWAPNEVRGCSYFYGPEVVASFLQKNGLQMLIRAHELQQDGYLAHFEGFTSARSPDTGCIKLESLSRQMRQQPETAANRKPDISASGCRSMGSIQLPLVLTVFSAPNYCDKYRNQATFLRVGNHSHKARREKESSISDGRSGYYYGGEESDEEEVRQYSSNTMRTSSVYHHRLVSVHRYPSGREEERSYSRQVRCRRAPRARSQTEHVGR